MSEHEPEPFLERLASSAPTPGGGSAAALCGGLGAALVAMVARIVLESPRRAERHAAAAALAERADALRAELRAAGARDEAAYAAVAAAQRLPRADDAQRETRATRLAAALAEAAEEPLRAAVLANGVIALCEEALALEHRGLASDLGCAAEFARAALRASAYNVRVNHAYMQDAARVAAQAAELERLEREGEAGADRVREGVAALLAP